MSNPRRREATTKRTFLGLVQTALVGGITLLQPIVLIVWLFQKAMSLVGKLAKTALALPPDSLAAGVVIGAIETSTTLLILAFAAGVMARSNLGQRFIISVVNSLIGRQSTPKRYEVATCLSQHL